MGSIIQRNFSAGEISPNLYSRVDTTRYQTGLRTCKNFLVMRHGGVTNRPGSQFIGEVKDSSKVVRLIPFIFNTLQTYVLEFGNLYVRFIKNGAYISDVSKNISAVTQAAQAVVTSAAHGFSNGDEVKITGVIGMTQLNGRNFKVSDVAANTFKLKYMDGSTYVDSTAFTAYISGGAAARIYTLTTTYLEADLAALKYVQSADVMTLAHPTYPPRELARFADANWTITDITFAPTVATPSGLVISTGSPGAGTVTQYTITAIASETFEESLQSGSTGSSGVPSSGTPFVLGWTDPGAGIQEWNVYKRLNGIYGFIGSASTNSFIDSGIIPDVSVTPPIARNPFGSTNNYPSTVSYFQQRLMFANTNNDPENIWGSLTGLFHNFTISTPLQDSDAVTFRLVGKQVNGVHHLVDLGKLAVFTAVGEWIIEGDTSGILIPGSINPKQRSYNGSDETLAPVVIDSTAIYAQARGSIVRDFNFDFQVDNYRGNDLTIFSAHLFDLYELVDMTYQKIPHSNVWIVRDDGILLGLTYVPEQNILGWHRHEFEDATVENVCSVPEGNEDTLYLTIKRTVNGQTKRYIEKFNTRQIDDVVDAVFVDSSFSYDGRNGVAIDTMTLSGGTTWDYTETLTLTSSAAIFESTDTNREIHLTGSDGTIIRFAINAFSSSTVVTGKANRTVPVSMRSVAISTWTEALQIITGIWHLEGKQVSVFADGFVVGNPNNPAYDVITVANGQVDLGKAYGVIHIGLPITADIETLNIDSSQTETISDKMKQVNRLSVHLVSSRGIWAGATPPEDEDEDFLGGLVELKIRNTEGYDDPVRLATSVEEIIIRPEWNSNGRVFIRQTDPLPLSITAIVADGVYPFKRGV